MKNSIIQSTSKKRYAPPLLQVELVVIEHSIAAGSATVTPVNSTSQVREEWETGADVVGDHLW